MTTPLGQEIAFLIAAEGPMSFERYMELCLAHPRHGYYMTRDPLGAQGDFVTSPEISQMFGELVGVWATAVWQSLGEPASVRLVELGPGRGTLMADALRAAQAMRPFLNAIEVCLVETSPVLRERQREALAALNTPVTWAHTLDDVADGPMIVIANEFFDALPVRHYVRAEGHWRERHIGLDAQDRLAYGLAPEPEDAIRAPAPDGAVLEIGAAAHAAMGRLADRLVAHRGAALVIDYGHVQTGFGETAQALRRHEPVGVLDAPGECDLTAHVDFASLARAAKASGAEAHGPVLQANLLTSLGVFERAAQLKRKATPRQALDIDRAVARLTSVATIAGATGAPVPGMGALFKALAVTSPGLPVPPGFPGYVEPFA